MPKHKTLQSVANSFADSFGSPMNRAEGAFVMSELRSSAALGSNEIAVDLLSDKAPEQSLTPSALAGVAWYRRQFPDMVARSNSSMAFVREAILKVTFSPTEQLQTPRRSSEAICEVTIVDDRGKTYIGRKLSWWDFEGPAPMSRTTRFARFLARLAARLLVTFGGSPA